MDDFYNLKDSQILSQGSFGYVYVAKNKFGKKVALKIAKALVQNMLANA